MTAQTLLHNRWLHSVIALMAGALLTLSFAPYNIATFALLAPALLLITWLNTTPKTAFLRGYLFGLSFFGTGVYWIYISIHTYGEATRLLSYTLTLGFIAFLACFPALVGYWLSRYFPKTNDAKLLLAFPAIWVFVEWMRSWFLTGFPWLLLGYSQIHTPLKGYAPILSVYGTSLALALSAGLLIKLALLAKQGTKKAIIPYLIGFLSLWILGGGLSLIAWTKPQGTPVQISLIQGNIPQELKWEADQVQPTLDIYTALTQDHWDSQIIIWPEAAIPLSLQNASNFVNQLSQAAAEHHTSLMTGIPVKASERGEYYNAVIALGDGKGAYLKRRLVPFGEYVPLPNVLHKILSSLNIPMSDFIPGPRNAMALNAGAIKIATSICFEIAFPEVALNRDSTVGMILAVSNDAWFGHSSAQAQHLQTGMMRAIEMQRPVLFSSNDGITAIISPNGSIQSQIPIHLSTVLTDKVQARSGLTPWQRRPMDPILLILSGMLLLAVRLRKA